LAQERERVHRLTAQAVRQCQRGSREASLSSRRLLSCRRARDAPWPSPRARRRRRTARPHTGQQRRQRRTRSYAREGVARVAERCASGTASESLLVCQQFPHCRVLRHGASEVHKLTSHHRCRAEREVESLTPPLAFEHCSSCALGGIVRLVARCTSCSASESLLVCSAERATKSLAPPLVFGHSSNCALEGIVRFAACCASCSASEVL